MHRPASSDTASLLDPPRRPGRSAGQPSNSAHSRRIELAAAFGSDDEDDDNDNDNDNGRRVDTRLAMPVPSPTSTAQEVFFDAGDALHQSDPLGAHQANQADDRAPPYSHAVTLTTPSAGLGGGAEERAYDFEGASYFTPTRPNNSRSASVNVSRAASPGVQGRTEAGNEANATGLRSVEGNQSSVSRMRIALGRFGRFVGMRVPGATYSSLSTEDEVGGRPPRSSARGVMGGGMGQDGVFANMNAKPERRRRRGENGEDRGDDDDLVDDILPPTYETAAADVAPPYWETTIIGGPGGLHPLAPGGMGWTPGGAHVGAIEDLIVEGLPVGNFFGFAWNLLVSMSFQFVGFLLTYLLHTTHAARCGSRAGLGITLVQYGFYLRTRAMQISDGKMPDDGLSPLPGGSDDMASGSAHTVWWSSTIKSPLPIQDDSKRDWVARSISLIVRQTISLGSANATVDGGNATMADALASDSGAVMGPSAESIGASTEWLAYILMGIGWFILLSSVLSYWRVHRWGRQLVEAARRESDNEEGAGAGGQEGSGQDQDSTPVGFLHTIGRAFRGNGGRRNDRRPRGHSAEDWVIFPGRHRSSEIVDDTDVEAPPRNSDERLLHSMRNVGLLA